MSYGLSVTNDFNSVVISSDYKVLVFAERRLFQITSRYSDREGGAELAFLKPITTVEPPHVFVRYISGRHPGLSLYLTMRGSSGNWTGFKVTSAVAGGSTTQNFAMEFVACKYSDTKSKDNYGLELFGEDGKIVYSSSDRIVRYSRFTKAWKYVNGRYVDEYLSQMAIDPDDFISISSFDFGVAWFTGSSNYAGLKLLTGGVRSLTMNVNKDTTMGFPKYQERTMFSLPICKFPIERYYNT